MDVPLFMQQCENIPLEVFTSEVTLLDLTHMSVCTCPNLVVNYEVFIADVFHRLILFYILNTVSVFLPEI